MVKTKTNYECEECGKILKNARALAGHLWFAHGKRAGEKASLYDNIKTLEREKGIDSDASDKISEIKKTLDGVNEKIEQLLKKTQKEQPHNPDEKLPEKKEEIEKKLEEEDDGLLDIITPLFKAVGIDISDKDDDDDSIFL